MPEGQTELPEFENPPVSEVALGIQFKPLTQFTNIHSGLLWQRFSQELPSVAENPTLPPTFETFAPPTPSTTMLMPKFEMIANAPVARYWFVSVDETVVFQIQQDRVVVNWRRRRPEDVYPRYAQLRTLLATYVQRLSAFLAEGRLGEIKPNQVELTYVNEIFLDEGDDPRSQFEKVTPLWTGKFSDGPNRKIEDASVMIRCQIAEPESPPSGRLTVTIQGAFKHPAMSPIVHMQLVARGRPKEETVDSALEWIDLGHAEVVRGFASVTSEEMHSKWGRIYAGH
jgi:uncharacterized protein (TIGR04255 family)